METRTVVVTGASRGLGKLIATGAAARGARVVLACRDPKRGAAARDEVAAAAKPAGGPEPELLALDLASFTSVRAAAAEALRRWPRIDGLVNNAGVFSRSYAETEDGFELSIGTNFLGPFLFTQLLLSAMGPGSRIVNLSSSAYSWGATAIDSPERGGGAWKGFMNYAASKRAVLLGSLALAERLADRGVAVNALHPGVVRTRIMHMDGPAGIAVDVLLAPFYSKPDRGVAAALGLLLSPEFEGVSGRYYDREKPRKPAARVVTKARIEENYKSGLRLVGLL
jgi:NAD(P)-dependent dehydrogenase (short-subunit alcohol dehydrogenase family)